MASDAPRLIEAAVKAFLEEVPQLKPMQMVVAIDLIGGRSDMQQFRVELPEVVVKKDIVADAKVRLEMRREFFNAMVEHGAKVADWREAFYGGQLRASGGAQYLKLIRTVVEKQEERDRLRRATEQRARQGHMKER
jgi:pyruvate-formate lyase